ncbi:MAG: AMP-binding protein, partial [Mycobacteriales bacterium]
MHPGKWSAVAPDRTAVVLASTGASLTYAELDRDSIRLARLFAERGLRRGDVVALISDNRVEAFVPYWATRRSGLYITAANSHLTADEAAYVLRDCGAKAVVVSAGVGAMAEAACAGLPGDTVRLSYGGPVAGFEDMATALEGVSDAPLDAQPKGADMLYSSGTTGRPKGVKPPLPEGDVDAEGDMIALVFGGSYGFGEDTVYLSPAPIYHAAPLRFSAAVQALGGTVVMMERFDAEGALRAIQDFSVTHSQWVPTMFVRMLKLPDEVRMRYDVSSLKIAIHAAAPCPVEVKRKMIEWWGPVLVEYYAATEAVGITMIDSNEWLAHPGSVGRSLLGPIHIVDEDGRELPPGQAGTVYFTSPTGALPFVYHGDPDKTRSASHSEHPDWGTTGDIGYVDEDGWLFLTDRKAFMIISGGVNIYPQEVENVLALHPAITDVAVIGVPDDEMGERV